MARCPAQAVLPLVGLAAEKVIRDRYMTGDWFGGLEGRFSETGRNCVQRGPRPRGEGTRCEGEGTRCDRREFWAMFFGGAFLKAWRIA
ncbi:MAG: hypothetical protein ACQESR_07290 [Planctomycetota bacterium]